MLLFNRLKPKRHLWSPHRTGWTLWGRGELLNAVETVGLHWSHCLKKPLRQTMCVSHKFSKCTTQKPKWFPAQILMCFEIYNRLLKMLGNGPKAFSELLQAKQARPPDTKLDQPIMMRWTRQHSGRILESVQVDSSARPMSPPVTHKTPLDVSLQNHNYNQWHSVMHCSSQSQKKKTFLKS